MNFSKLKMKIVLLCILFIIVRNQCSSIVISDDVAPYENTTNSCFYASGRYITGTELTRITISGTSTEDFLATCCYMCRALPDCVAWYYFTLLSVCMFFSSVNSLPAYGSFYYAGATIPTKFWACNEQQNKWYYESSLAWTRQTSVSSRSNRESCCHDCFWSTAIGGCLSWTYYEDTNDCYHSSKNLNTSVSVNVSGMYTGSVSMAFPPYQQP